MQKPTQALNAFFSSFSIPAYTSKTVPDKVELPYIAYGLTIPEWRESRSLYAIVWDRTSSNEWIVNKADEIISAIGDGLLIDFDGGHMVIRYESSDLMIDEDCRGIYINLTLNVYSVPGV